MIKYLRQIASWFFNQNRIKEPKIGTKAPKIRRCKNLAEASGQANTLTQKSGKDYSILYRSATDVIIVHTKKAPIFIADGYQMAFNNQED